MCPEKTSGNKISIGYVINLVMSTRFFKDKSEVILTNTVLNEISIRKINLPARLIYFAGKHDINSLEDLLNTNKDFLLRFRNIGMRTVIVSRKIILDYLYEMEECLKSCCPECCMDNVVVSYFPLLEGCYRTSKFYHNLVYRDLSFIDIPKRIREYFQTYTTCPRVINLLNITPMEFKSFPLIGFKTVNKLQNNLITILNLEKIIFLSPCCTAK